MLFNIVLSFQMLLALIIIVLVLMQHGKGADMGAALGSSTSGSFFGSAGSSNFLSRSTSLIASAFFIITLFLAQIGNQQLVPKDNGMINSPAKTQRAPRSVPSGSIPS